MHLQDDTYTESYISTIGVDFVSLRRMTVVCRHALNSLALLC